MKSVRVLALALVKPELSFAYCRSEGNKPLELVLPSSILLGI